MVVRNFISRSLSRIVPVIALGAMAGCGEGIDGIGGGDPDGVPCTAESRIAIAMRSVDAGTALPVRLASVTVKQTAGPSNQRYVDTRLGSEPHGEARDANGALLPLQITADGEAVLENLVGTFDVVLRADGYRDFSGAGIEVTWTTDGCYKVAQPVTLHAAMVRRMP